MTRLQLVTKELMNMIIRNRGFIQNRRSFRIGEAIGEDLDRFVENLKIGSNCLGKKQEGLVHTLQFFQLTEGELKLLENRNTKFMSSFQFDVGFPIKWNEMEFKQIVGSRLTLKWSERSRSNLVPLQLTGLINLCL